MNLLYVDVHEPYEILELLEQSHKTVRASINPSKPDYAWTDIKGFERGVTRKQMGELLGDLDAFEDQLNRDIASCDEITALFEGVAVPTGRGAQIFKRSPDGKFWHPYTEIPRPEARPQPGLWKRFEGLRWSLEHECGVSVISTVDMETSAHAISAAFRLSMKSEHTTLQRYVIPHIPPFNINRHVDNLARLKGAGIGVERAKKLIATHNTFYDTVVAPVIMIENDIGVAATEKFLSTLGRWE